MVVGRLIGSSNMTHSSTSDPNAHYSVQGMGSDGSKVNDGHVQEDESKQTVSDVRH